MTARVQPSRALAVRAFAALAGRRTGTRPPAVFLTLGRHQQAFWPWLAFAGSLLAPGGLSRAETELVVLRAATLAGSEYELRLHRRIARGVGLSAADVERVAAGPGSDGWTPRQRVLLRAVDRLHAEEDLDDATWADLAGEYGERTALEVVLVAGHYRMLATAIRVARLEPDATR